MHPHSCCIVTVTSHVILADACTVYRSHTAIPLSYDLKQGVNLHPLFSSLPPRVGVGGLNYNMTHWGDRLIRSSKMLAGTICLLIYHLPQRREEIS